MSDCSNDAKSRKDECALWGPTDIHTSPHSGGGVKSPNLHFYGANEHFQAKPADIKFAKISAQ